MILKNITNKVKHFKLKKEWKSLDPGKSMKLPEGVYDSEKGLEIITDNKKTLPINTHSEEIPIINLVRVYNKTGLKALKKNEQIELLKRYGLSDKEIKSLRFERQRVSKLLGLQNEME